MRHRSNVQLIPVLLHTACALWTTSISRGKKGLASVPKDRCVMATSSTRMLNSLARCVRLSRTYAARMGWTHGAGHQPTAA